MQNEFILFYYRSGSWGMRCLSPATVRPFAASGPRVWGHSRFSPAAFRPRAGHLSVQHFTLHQPKQGRQGLSFVAEGAAASRPSKWERILGVSLWAIRSGNTLQFGKIPPPLDGVQLTVVNSASKASVLQLELSSLLQKGAIEENRSRTSNEGSSAEEGRRPETRSGSTAFEFFPKGSSRC